MMQFAIDNEIQSHLEAVCIDILGTAEVLEGGNDIKTKKPGDVLIQADIVCDRKYKEAAKRLGVHYHSEETRGDFNVCEKGEVLILADPIDGSSEFGR